MARKIAMALVILLVFSPVSTFAEKTGSAAEDVSEKYDRHKDQGGKVIDSSSSDIDSKIEKEKDALDLEKNRGKTDAAEAMEKLGKGTYRFTGQVLFEVQRNSFPICLLGIIAGALIFFVFGPRNMTRRRFGAMLMFGFFSIWVIAQIAPVVFLVMIQS